MDALEHKRFKNRSQVNFSRADRFPLSHPGLFWQENFMKKRTMRPEHSPTLCSTALNFSFPPKVEWNRDLKCLVS